MKQTKKSVIKKRIAKSSHSAENSNFTVTYPFANIQQAPNYAPIYESETRSYTVHKTNGKYVIYQTFRKNKKPLKVATYKAKNSKEAITRFKSKEPLFESKTNFPNRSKYTTSYRQRVYTNQPRAGTFGQYWDTTAQCQVVCRVHDLKGGRPQTFIGYSKQRSMPYHHFTAEMQGKMEEEAINSAIGNYINAHNPKPYTERAYERLLEEGSPRYETEIMQFRWIIWKKQYKNTKEARKYGGNRVKIPKSARTIRAKRQS